jgi:hypothetical protein
MTSEGKESAIDLDRLRSDLAEARERVRDLEQLIILAERWYGRGPSPSLPNDASKPNGVSSESEPEDKPTTPPPTTLAPAEGPFARMGAREAAVQLLRTTGTVWKVDAATQELLKLGWQTNSPAPETVVRSAMMRDKRIERVAPGQFRYREPGSPASQSSQLGSEAAESEGPDGETGKNNGTRLAALGAALSQAAVATVLS